MKGGFWLGGPLVQTEAASCVLTSGDSHHSPQALAYAVPCCSPHSSGSAWAPLTPVCVLATHSLMTKTKFVHVAKVPATQKT